MQKNILQKTKKICGEQTPGRSAAAVGGFPGV